MDFWVKVADRSIIETDEDLKTWQSQSRSSLPRCFVPKSSQSHALNAVKIHLVVAII
jgi:hypothetical protein